MSFRVIHPVEYNINKTARICCPPTISLPSDNLQITGRVFHRISFLWWKRKCFDGRYFEAAKKNC